MKPTNNKDLNTLPQYGDTPYNPLHVGAFNARHSRRAQQGFNQQTVDDDTLDKQFSNDDPHPEPDATFTENDLGDNEMSGRKQNSPTVFE